MPAALIAAAKDSRVLLEDRFGLLLGQSARNDAELGQAIGYLGRLGEAPRSRSGSPSMIGSGVPAGAEKPFQDENSKPGNVSATAGMSGAAAIRCAVPTASSRILSLLMCGSSSDELPKYRSTWPEIRSETACGLALGRDHDQIDAGAREQQHRREMADVLRAGDGEVELAGIGFRIGDEFRQRS